ncbi:MAG: uroporphyrinogen-III C-methyltransferase [Nitrosomonas sp.]|nr:uroporphyrinogen-III C-methyltransferase [Nitrosomonas sp.]
MKKNFLMRTDTQHSSSKSARRFARWLLIILLIAVTFMGWEWAKTQGYIADFQRTLTQYLADADVFGNRARGMIAQIDSVQLDMDQRLDQLAASLLSIDNQRHTIAQHNIEAITSNGSDKQVLGVVTRLVYFADQFLRLTGDTENAQIVLKQALVLLQQSERLMAAGIGAVLTGDIQQLETANHLNRAEIYQDINRYAEQIDQLPLAMKTHLLALEPPEIQSEAASSGYWPRVLAEIRQDLSQLIHIKKLDSETTVLLSPSQIQLLHGNVKLQLKQAQLALLTRDQDTFTHGLEAALDLISRYFDTQHPAVVEIQTELSQHMETAEEMAYPDLQASLQALQSAQIKLERGDE